MAKLKWRNRKQGWSGETRATRAIERAADRILAGYAEPKKRAPYKVRKYAEADPSGINIVVGADAPSNKTGERIVYTFRTLKEAHAAGFTWAV